MHQLIQHTFDNNLDGIKSWFEENTYEENKNVVEHAFELSCRSECLDIIKELEKYLEYGHDMEESFKNSIENDNLYVFLHLFHRYGDIQDEKELTYTIMDYDAHRILAVFLSGKDDEFVKYVINYVHNFDSPKCEDYLKVRERVIKLKNL